MAESYSVRARLSATDSGFTSTINKARGALSSLGGQIKSGFAFGILTGAGQAAFNKITSSVTELIGEVNSSNASWKTFTKNMQMIGKSDKEIEGVKKELQEFAEQTVFSSSDMAQTFSQLEAVGTKNTTKLVKGFGGLAAAAENPQQAMKTLSQQATQMAAKPNVAWQDFKLMLEQTPAGIAAVAKEMGMTTSELVTNIQDGKVATDKFFDAIAKVGTNDAFTELATEAKTIGQAMDGLKESLANKLTPAFEVLNQKGISIVDKLADKLNGINADKLATKVGNLVTNISKYATALFEAFSGVGTEVWGAVKEIISALFGMEGAFGSASSVEGFKSAMQSVADIIKKVASFAKEHAGAIATLIKWLPAIVIGIKGFKIASAVAPAVTMFAKGIAGLASKGIGGIASKLFGISKSQKTVGTTSATSGAQMLTAAKSYALMGVAVLAIALGFALLAQSAIALANAGGLAIGVMAGLVVALAAIGIGMAVLLKSLAPMSSQLMPVAMAMLAMGAAVVLVAAGFALLAATSIALANAGGAAIAVMILLVAVIAVMAIGAAALAPALTAGAVGLIAFGAALTLCGIAAVLLATSILIVSLALPAIAEHGLSAAVAFVALGAAMGVFAAGALLAGAAALLLAPGLLVAAAASLLLAAGVIALAAGCVLLGAGLTVCVPPLTVITALLPSTAAGALAVTAAFTLLSVTALLLSANLLILSGAALAASVGIIALGAGLIVAAAGMLVMAAGLIAVNAQMSSIASNARDTEASLTSMSNSVKFVENGLKALGSKAKSAMKALTKAFDDTAADVEASGRKIGTGLVRGLASGLSQVMAIALMLTAAVTTTLSSGQVGAYNAGAFISQGFANGMLSMLGVIRNAASKMAAEADKAVRAKAKISSPSKVADKLGGWWGEGYENGLLSSAKNVWDAAEKLVSIPTVATPDLALAYSGELSADYDYYRNAEYKIVVPLSVDGREFAKAEAAYMQDELDRQQTRNERKYGNR